MTAVAIGSKAVHGASHRGRGVGQNTPSLSIRCRDKGCKHRAHKGSRTIGTVPASGQALRGGAMSEHTCVKSQDRPHRVHVGLNV